MRVLKKKCNFAAIFILYDDEMDVVDNEDKVKKTLKYEGELRYFADIIEERYDSKTVEVFRTVRTNPPTDEDLVPLQYQHTNSLEYYPLEITQDVVDVLSKDEKVKEVGRRSLSVNETCDKCIKEARRSFNSYVKKKNPTQEAIEDYKKNRGVYVAKFKITPELGIITNFHKTTKHAQVLLYDNVKIEDVWDAKTPVLSFKYEK